MSVALVGYARTSTNTQQSGIASQIDKLKAAGCTKLFEEHASGASRDSRPALAEALNYIREGDTFVVTRADRLARNTMDLLQIVKFLETKDVALQILDFGGNTLDTKGSFGKVVLTLFAAFAQFERDVMLERQREGIARAKAEGRFIGRAPTARRKFGEIEAMYNAGAKTAQITKALSLSRASVFRALKIIRDGKKTEGPEEMCFPSAPQSQAVAPVTQPALEPNDAFKMVETRVSKIDAPPPATTTARPNVVSKKTKASPKAGASYAM